MHRPSFFVRPAQIFRKNYMQIAGCVIVKKYCSHYGFSSTLLRIGGLVLGLLASTQAWAALGASVTLASGQPGTIYPSETTQLQITLSNSNPASAINGVAFSNLLPGTLPNGLKVAGAATYFCTDPSVPVTAPGVGVLTATTGTQVVDLVGGVIPARANSTDGTCTILIPVTAGTSNGDAATYTYTIANGAVTGNDGGAIANAGAVNQSINVRAMALPTLSKSFTSNTLFYEYFKNCFIKFAHEFIR